MRNDFSLKLQVYLPPPPLSDISLIVVTETSSSSWNHLSLPQTSLPPFFWWWWWSYMMLFAYEKIIAHKYILDIHTRAFYLLHFEQLFAGHPPITTFSVFLDFIYTMLILLSVIRINVKTHSISKCTLLMPWLRNNGHLLIV